MIAMEFNIQRLGALVRKETIQIFRDRRFLALLFGLTFVQVFVYGYSASKTVYHIPLGIVDQSRSTKSREFLTALENSQYFDAKLYLQSQDEIGQAINNGDVKAGVFIPRDFASESIKGSASIVFLFDGADQFAVQSAYGAANAIARSFGLIVSAGTSSASGELPINVSMNVLYNPDLDDKWFVIPGVIGMILQTLAIEQAAIFLIQDREWGTLEQILATPVRQIEIVLSKMIPLLVLCLAALGVSMGLGVFWFGVPFQGSLLLYLWLAVLFITSCLGLGLLISTRVNTQFEANGASMFFMLFGLLLSGLFYPRIDMPLIPQLLGDLVPLTYFIRISRGIYLKGIGLNFLWSDALILVFYALVVVLIASRRFKMRLD
jgi:ABC-2 type transport system permease protein